MARFHMTIDGKQSAGLEWAEICNPANLDAVGEYAVASNQDLETAVSAAKTAARRWRETPLIDRAKLIDQCAQVLEDHSEELAALLTAEQGKTLNGMGARFEVGGAVAWTRYTASLSLSPVTIEDSEEAQITMHRKPIGVVASITPWNWPLMITIWHVMPALLSGNTVVTKPSPLTPLTVFRAIELLNTILPAGVLNCISGDVEEGSYLSSHPDIGKVVFTGSCSAGRHIMANAAPTLKKLTLELGGNDAGIVLPDCDPKTIAEGLFWGAFINNGQTCAALKRLYVHDSIYDDVCESLSALAQSIPMGNGADENNLLGPLQNKPQFDKVSRFVSEAQQKGGRILCGGNPPDDNGYFYPVTIVADASDDMALVREEQFGPALPVLRYSDIEDVIARANSSEVGLGGSVWSQDVEQAKLIGQRLECGTVWINQHGALRPDTPFGGVKASGLGVEFGELGLKEYTTTQIVFR